MADVAPVLAILVPIVAWSVLSSIPPVITHGSREGGKIALTFDACMTVRMEEALLAGKVEGWYDDRIVSILEREAVSATIFATGLWAKNYSEVIRKLSGNPLFEIGNHSFDHGAFSRPCYGLPPAKEKTAEVTKTQEILYRVSGKLPTFFRFPGGCSSAIDHARIYLLGVRAVGWDVNSADAFSDDGQKIVDRVLSNTQGGSIIVMHLSVAPNAPATALVLPTIIKGLRDRGFSFVTISELIAQPEAESSWTLFSEP